MDRIVFRVDSSLQIGSGHLMRCLTLARRWKKEKEAKIYFISRDLDGALLSLVKENGFILCQLLRHPKSRNSSGYAAWLTVPQKKDAEDTRQVLSRLGCVDCLVVDHYALDIVWEHKMRPFTNRIFVIDDLANRRHDCDVLLDQNFYRDMDIRYKGLVPKDCELRLGPKYALLREEFYEARRHLRKREGNIRNILVFYGGIDQTNETMKACKALVELALPGVTADVVVGESNPHRGEVEAFCRVNDFLRYHCQVDNMAELMNQADLALGAGGTATWERLFLELPSIVTAVAENQVKVCEDCTSVGYMEYLGFFSDVTEDKVKEAIRERLLHQER